MTMNQRDFANSDQPQEPRLRTREYQPRDPNRPQDDRPRPPRRDSQIILTARAIDTQNGEAMVFEFKVWMFKVCCIVNFPRYEDEKTAPVYVRLKPLHRIEADDVVQPSDEFHLAENG